MQSAITLIVFLPVILFLIIGILPNSRKKNRQKGRRNDADSNVYANYDSMDSSSHKGHHHHNHHHHVGHSHHASHHGDSHASGGDSGGGDSGGGDGGGGGD